MMSFDDETVSDADRLALALRGLATMRHDLRNLLSSVSIIASRLEALGDERLTRAGGEITTNMEGIIALGVAAQELAEIGPEPPASLPLGDMAAAAAEAAGVEIDADGLEPLAAYAAGRQAVRALELILLNSKAAMDPGGRPRISGQKEGGKVVAYIADSGGGIPDYAVKTLFEPFAGAKKRGGAGLGLPIAARLAAVNGGRVSLVRTGPEGTVMAMELPAN